MKASAPRRSTPASAHFCSVVRAAVAGALASGGLGGTSASGATVEAEAPRIAPGAIAAERPQPRGGNSARAPTRVLLPFRSGSTIDDCDDYRLAGKQGSMKVPSGLQPRPLQASARCHRIRPLHASRAEVRRLGCWPDFQPSRAAARNLTRKLSAIFQSQLPAGTVPWSGRIGRLARNA